MNHPNENDTELIKRLKAGDKASANELIARYYDRVVRTAQRRLSGCRIRATSEEDVALSVFESLWQRAEENRFADDELSDSDELWRLLCKMVRFKAHDHVRREKAQKRGGEQLRGESVFHKAGEEPDAGIEHCAADFESVSKAVDFRDHFQHLLQKLEDADLCQIATMRLEDQSVKEIAKHFDRSDRWVKRKLALIRGIWNAEVE